MARYMLAILLFAHVLLMFAMIGAGTLDVMVFFPNWFHNIPDSLAVAKQFNSYRNPGMFFLPLGATITLTGVAFVLAAWTREPSRTWVLIDLVLFIAALLLTVAFIYPRISIVVGEGSELQSLEVLQQAAMEMKVLIQVRLWMMYVSAAFAVFALWRFTANVPKIVEPVPEPPKTVEE